MTVEAQNPDGTPIVKSGPYNGNGVTTAFNYTFPITAIGEVKVVRQNADLTETVLVLTTDYSVTGAGNPAGGQVILNSGALLPTGAKLVLLLDMAFDQAVDYSNQGRIQLSLLEVSLDKLTLAARQLREELLRAVTVDAFGTVDIAQLRTNINALAAIEAQIVTVSNNIANVQTVASISANVTTVAGIAANVTTVANNIAAINTNSANIAAIQDAATNAANAATSATNAANSASAAATSATNAANSATSAQGSATAAATSEANAANSAAQAATSAASMVVATQPQAEAATDNVAYMSSLRTKQQIDARLATQAEAEAGTDNTKLMTPLRLRNALNANGAAPIYACRAWVNFNGTGTVAIRASGNVSSITDNGVGDYTVNFTTAMPDADYSVSGSANNLADFGRILSAPHGIAPSTGSVRVRTSDATPTAADHAYVYVAIHR